MELNPHDLIRIANLDHLVTAQPDLPEWAVFSLVKAPYVVVRRSPQPNGFAAVGIRGLQRGQRLAAWLKYSDIQEIVRPNMLIADENWKVQYANELSKPILSLKKITSIMNQTGLCWGPTGSAGFELATGIKTLTENSDLDVILTAERPLPIEYAASLLKELESVALVRLDIQLNTPLGGSSLKEYITSATVLVKTLSGPLLVKPSVLWSSQELYSNH
jgi:phosphoribosyl-dephospho-CoA transferase